jgi:hypothetical protein
MTLNEKSSRRDQMLVSLSVSCVPTDKPQLGGPIPGFGLVHARVGKEPAEGVGVVASNAVARRASSSARPAPHEDAADACYLSALSGREWYIPLQSKPELG